MNELSRLLLDWLAVPAMTWAIAVLWLLRDIKRSSDRLLDMHENPENTGFGTALQDEHLRALTHVLKDLVHYVKVDIEVRTGQPPRPPPPEVPNGLGG